MGIFTRIRRLLRANINDTLDKAEDPAKMLNFLVIEMQESLEQARSQVAEAMAAERRLAQQAQEAQRATDQWADRARLALVHGQEELAREALRRKLAAGDLAAYYQRAQTEQAEEVRKLRPSLDRLERRLLEAKARRTKLLAQVQTTKAQTIITRSVRQAVGSDAFEAFDHIAGQVEMAQHRAGAIAELSHNDLEENILVTAEAAAIERELSQIKGELGYIEGEVAPVALEHRE